jgi:hypothetical protein
MTHQREHDAHDRNRDRDLDQELDRVPDELKHAPADQARDEVRGEMDARGERPGAGVTGHERVVGEGAGGIAGAAAGAALGSLGGPLGTVVGGIAGAIGGWWAGREIGEAAESWSEEEDRHWREEYESAPDRLADRGYEVIRPAYQLGYIAAHHPGYRHRPFEAIEEDLQKGWTDEHRRRHGDWRTVRGFASRAYRHRSTALTQGSADLFGQSGALRSNKI